MTSSDIRTDARALAMIEEYRGRFSSAPIGTWVDCIDNFMGMGFSGVSGKFAQATFLEDGTGSTADEDERLLFEWKRVGDRIIDVRCIEHIPALEGWTEEELEEDRQWHRVEYDFVVPAAVNVPTIVDASQLVMQDCGLGAMGLQFLQCLTYRFSGALRLQEHSQGQLPRLLFVAVSPTKKAWWQFW
jgi:hypothetical protein